MVRKKIAESEPNTKHERTMLGIAIWTSFYRANPHRFAADYLNIKLKLFQQLLIYMMNYSTNFIFIAARGLGKSFLCAVFCVIRCILYPGTKITIAAKVRSQSVNILDEKILKILYPKSANLRAEIKSWSINKDAAEIIFKNGSYIKVVTSTDNARGSRANILICDEFRMIDKIIIDSILKKFLGDPRHPGYLDNPIYQNLQERNKEIYLSSAWYMAHWSWEKCKDYFSMMCDTTKRYFCCCFPYQMSIKEGLLMKEQVEDEMSESTFSDIIFKMEMCSEWIGVIEGGLFNFDSIEKTRVLKDAVYVKDLAGISAADLDVPKKKSGEIRIITADIALMNSKKRDNDATSIFVNFLLPDKNGKYISNFVYTENQEGMSTPDLTLKLRRYLDYFDADYIGLDCKGLGLPIADLLMHDVYDPEFGITYPAITCCNNDEIASRCNDRNAEAKLWAIMGSSTFNNDVVIALRSGFSQGRIRMLISEYDCESAIKSKIKGYDKLSPYEKVALKMPYMNTRLAVTELVNLGYEINNNLIKVKEKSGCRKDRYSSMSYNYYIAQCIERDIERRSVKNKNVCFEFKPPVFRKGGF